jgi:hypothetical protein
MGVQEFEVEEEGDAALELASLHAVAARVGEAVRGRFEALVGLALVRAELEATPEQVADLWADMLGLAAREYMHIVQKRFPQSMSACLEGVASEAFHMLLASPDTLRSVARWSAQVRGLALEAEDDEAEAHAEGQPVPEQAKLDGVHVELRTAENHFVAALRVRVVPGVGDEVVVDSPLEDADPECWTVEGVRHWHIGAQSLGAASSAHGQVVDLVVRRTEAFYGGGSPQPGTRRREWLHSVQPYKLGTHWDR